jgi:hypothetical protein
MRKAIRSRRAISSVIIVMLSLILIVIVVANVVLWSYQMNQLDWEKMRENVAIANVTSAVDIWSYNPSAYALKGSTTLLSGSVSSLTADDSVYMTFRSYNSGTDVTDFVDNRVSDVDYSPDKGTHSNFDNQKAKDNNNDTLTEVNTANFQKYYASNANLLGSTQLVSGSVTDLQSNDGVYMTFKSWPSQNSSGIFGNTNINYDDYYPIENTIVGSVFTAADSGWADSITAYLQVTSSSKNVKCAIYKQSDLSLVGYTQERTISPSSISWQTFSFNEPKPSLTAGTQYILVAWSSSGYGDTYFYRQDGAIDQAYYDDITYGSSWPDPFSVDAHGARSYCIYCTYTRPTEYTSEVEFTGTSNTQIWSRMIWTVDGSYTTSGVATTFQLYNYQSGTYPTSGDGYNLATIGTSDVTMSQSITTNPTYYRDASGNCKLKLTGKKATSSAFNCKVDLVQYEAGNDNYQLDLEEQWTTADYGEANEYLCIYTGILSPENPKEDLNVDVWNGSAWTTLMTLSSTDSNTWKNASISSYLTSSTLTIRFKDGNETDDTVQNSWNIDATLLHTWHDEYTADVEFIGSSNTEDWTQLDWTANNAWTVGSVNVTLQLYDYALGSYPTSGNGYIAYTSSSTPNTDENQSQTINVDSTDFRNATGYWKVKVKGVKAGSTQFDFKADWVEFKPFGGSGTLFTFKNEGSLTVHLVSLWINNSTHHQRYEVSIFINSGETTSYVRSDISLPDRPYVVKVATERGNIAVYSES